MNYDTCSYYINYAGHALWDETTKGKKAIKSRVVEASLLTKPWDEKLVFMALSRLELERNINVEGI